MKVAKTIAAVQSWRRKAPGKVILVPTMGALHHGHGALIQKAQRAAGKKGSVVVTIFVNPTQFGPKEDFSNYPRPLKNDLRVCRENGASLVFLPTVREMYPGGESVFVDETSLTSTLCGRSRPGHFRGVCTVVAKLFHIIQPDSALFGEKDWQQLAILRRMVRDLNFPVKIFSHPTVREDDGLATSSRNRYLNASERAMAPSLFGALHAASVLSSPAQIVKTARKFLSRIPGSRVDYVELVDSETLTPLKSLSRPGRLAAAMFLGNARLIDNVAVPARK